MSYSGATDFCIPNQAASDAPFFALGEAAIGCGIPHYNYQVFRQSV
jgi:hypothetical protein